MLLLTSSVAWIFTAPLTEGGPEVIYIMPDGSIVPTGFPIVWSEGKIILAGDINRTIVVLKNDLLIYGWNHTVEGPGSGRGFDLSNIHNVTITRTNVRSFSCGFYIHNSTSINMTLNTIRLNSIGAYIATSNESCLFSNTFSNNGKAILVENACNNAIAGNNIANNRDDATAGFIISVGGSDNSVLMNRVANNWAKEDLITISDFRNAVFENNVTGNSAQYIISLSGTNSTVQFNRIVGNNGLAISTVGNGHVIAGNNITDNTDGLRCGSFSTTVQRNILSGNRIGLSLSDSHNNAIYDNHIAYNSLSGLSIFSSPNNLLRNNTVEGNYRNIEIDSEQAQVSDFVQDIDSSNTVEGKKPICYRVNQANVKVPTESGFVALVNCHNATASGLELSENKQGILMVNTTDSKVAHNLIEHNDIGVRLELCLGNNISCNTITENEVIGILLRKSPSNNICSNNITSMAGRRGISVETLSHNTVIESNNIFGGEDGMSFYSLPSHPSTCNNATIANNTISNTTNGIDVYAYTSSVGNAIFENRIRYNKRAILVQAYETSAVVFHNSFINNSERLAPAPFWRWDVGYPSGGNYWNDYRLIYNATDLKNGPLRNKNGSDGIWDQPYVNGVTDMYPLVKPYAGPCDIVVRKWLDRNSTDPKPEKYPSNCTSVTINITLVNCGLEQEEVNFNFQINGTFYQQTFVLPARNSTTWVFVWNITEMPRGNYTVTAQVEPIPSETCTDDNCCSERVALTIMGDVNGDFKVNILDVTSITGRYCRRRGDPMYEANCDLNNNGHIDILDVVLCTSEYGKKYP